MSTLEFSITFDVPAKVIYNALLDQQEIMQYTRAPCKVEPKEGGEYRILDGRILGEFKQLIQDKSISMTWKFNDWASFSDVQITTTDGDDNCLVKITQKNIPKGVDLKNLEAGWRSQIFVPLSKIRGYPIDDTY